ncbi:MAG: glycosyltransferase [Ruminococcaceae bacterium]|nr:glycosyltransferase [Oscillospiraceae bacterium]
MKVLFLSVPTGQGHHQTAKAVLEYFKENENVECRFLDLVDNTSPFLAESLQKGYLLSTKVTPKMYGTFYDMADRRDISKNSNMGKLVKSVFNKKLLKYLKLYDPDIIVATHVLSAIAMTYIRKKYPLRAKIVAIVTDFALHPFWEEADIDYYVIASELLEFQALKKGLAASKLKPFGIPISPHFGVCLPKQEARAQLGLENCFTILLMMGSMGYGNNVFDAIRSLDNMKEKFQLLVVCGNNSKLKTRIDAMHKKKTIITYGYTNEVSTLMDAADCIITKPGGLSTSEALAKKLPIIMMDPIPGQEDRNKEFMLNNGLAMSVSDTFPINEAVYQLLHYHDKVNMLKNNMEYIAKPNAAKDLGDFMLALCDGKK